MNKLSEEQFKRLEPLEVFLSQSRHDYLVNQSMVNKEIVFEIHRKIFGGDIGRITCPTCVLRTYRRVADLYFEYKDSIVPDIEKNIVIIEGDEKIDVNQFLGDSSVGQEKVEEKTDSSIPQVPRETVKTPKNKDNNKAKKDPKKEKKTTKK